MKLICWMMSLLNFNKLFQIPLVILNKTYSLDFKDMVELFIVEDKKYPLISEINSLLKAKALAIQSGDCEYIPSRDHHDCPWLQDILANYAVTKWCRYQMAKSRSNILVCWHR